MTEEINTALLAQLRRLADAVERLAGPAPAFNDWDAAEATPPPVRSSRHVPNATPEPSEPPAVPPGA